MRVIAGNYRGRTLRSPPSMQVRPTSDRLRETLFNILAPRIEGGRFLDLCAGSGAVGIEALSRGAAHVTFVDQSSGMCALIEKNLYTLGVEDEVEVVHAEASEFLRRYARKQALVFDIVFFDPPYATDYEGVLKYLGEHAARLLAEEGLVIVEHHTKRDLKEKFSRVHRYRTLKQGDSLLSFYQMT